MTATCTVSTILYGQMSIPISRAIVCWNASEDAGGTVAVDLPCCPVCRAARNEWTHGCWRPLRRGPPTVLCAPLSKMRLPCTHFPRSFHGGHPETKETLLLPIDRFAGMNNPGCGLCIVWVEGRASRRSASPTPEKTTVRPGGATRFSAQVRTHAPQNPATHDSSDE